MRNRSEKKGGEYSRLVWLATVSFVGMYILLYTIMDGFINVNGINQFYMAGVLTMPMVIIEIILLGGMPRSRKVTAVIIFTITLAFIAFYLLIRSHHGVIDRRFLNL
ncbi:MAG TPA: hypothetical protein VK666_28100 [Chryseolinea sp.]|nr:hypothetical protein [Chryseolinea sp.]